MDGALWPIAELKPAVAMETQYSIADLPDPLSSAVQCDVTQKGYEKKRAKLLAPYVPQTRAQFLAALRAVRFPAALRECATRSQRHTLHRGGLNPARVTPRALREASLLVWIFCIAS
ncbi:Disco-interacting protein 2-like B-A [Acipenser ruthenus]|uniref:Disco-interacting protein 2-like B-A n=1 Tax=Acipenser ruthenus TaxID=7906 RepID=A0A444V153_ACIRT|nr:Disco-interacting protein 2-like B-A [Acipenser ruthenus]